MSGPSRSPDREELLSLEARLDAYLEKHLADFAEQDDISLPVYYRVSPEFIAAVRSQRLELARVESENERLKETAHRLAVLAIQSNRYAHEEEFKAAVDRALEIT